MRFYFLSKAAPILIHRLLALLLPLYLKLELELELLPIISISYRYDIDTIYLQVKNDWLEATLHKFGFVLCRNVDL